jgi:putative hydrolase of the HAD superfamily
MPTPPRTIQAITFDLWDTLVIDDSDEAERARRGLPSKSAARRDGFLGLAQANRPELPVASIHAAYDKAVATFRHWWKVEHHTPPIAEWLKVGLAELNIEDPGGLSRLAAQLGSLEVDIPPQPVPHVHALLESLHGKVPLGVVSDTINTPADGLRSILEQHALLRYFDYFAFSDEVGASKPAPDGFAAVVQAFGIPGTGIAHVGDRQETDVDGIQRFGGIAVMYTGAIDRHKGDTTAEVTCSDYRSFVAQLSAIGPFA